MPLFRHCPFDHSATQKLEWAEERCWTTHLWYDIGIDNDDLRTAGVGYEERMDKLGGRDTPGKDPDRNGRREI